MTDGTGQNPMCIRKTELKSAFAKYIKRDLPLVLEAIIIHIKISTLINLYIISATKGFKKKVNN
jgi:hypothetical protein